MISSSIFRGNCQFLESLYSWEASVKHQQTFPATNCCLRPIGCAYVTANEVKPIQTIHGTFELTIDFFFLFPIRDDLPPLLKLTRFISEGIGRNVLALQEPERQDHY